MKDLLIVLSVFLLAVCYALYKLKDRCPSCLGKLHRWDTKSNKKYCDTCDYWEEE